MKAGQKVTIIRHTQPNKDEPSDPPLSTVGRTQADKLTGHYELVVVSPLRRTLETYTQSNIIGTIV